MGAQRMAGSARGLETLIFDRTDGVGGNKLDVAFEC
jgi:hypothetical protein